MRSMELAGAVLAETPAELVPDQEPLAHSLAEERAEPPVEPARGPLPEPVVRARDRARAALLVEVVCDPAQVPARLVRDQVQALQVLGRAQWLRGPREQIIVPPAPTPPRQADSTRRDLATAPTPPPAWRHIPVPGSPRT